MGNIPGVLIPILGILSGTVITAGVVYAAIQIVNGPLGKALARRLEGRPPEPDPDLQGAVLELRDELQGLHRQLEETQERMDFAERLLAHPPGPSKLPPG